MLKDVVQLAIETLKAPKQSAERILAMDLDRNQLWLALTLVSVVSVLGSSLTMLFVPDEMINTAGPLPNSPFLLTAVIWGLLVVTVFCTYYVGRMFDGTGTMDAALITTVWMQVVLLVMQVAQIILFLFSPVIAVLFGYMGAAYVFYIFLNFVLVMHEFKSIGMVLAGTVASMIGILIGVSLILGLIAGLFGMEIPQNV